MSCEDAWAAGLFEGEGSTVLTVKDGRARNLRIIITMKDDEPVTRWGEWAGKALTHCYAADGQPRHTCQVSGDMAMALFERMRPWLSARRIARYEEPKAAWDARGPDRRYTQAAVAACGHTKPASTAGYDRHRCRGEPSCAACLAARRDYAKAA